MRTGDWQGVWGRLNGLPGGRGQKQWFRRPPITENGNFGAAPCHVHSAAMFATSWHQELYQTCQGSLAARWQRLGGVRPCWAAAAAPAVRELYVGGAQLVA